MTPLEAWEDFWEKHIKTAPAWRIMTVAEKRTLYRAEFDRKRGGLGAIRIQTLLTRHAQERYEFQITVKIKE